MALPEKATFWWKLRKRCIFKVKPLMFYAFLKNFLAKKFKSGCFLTTIKVEPRKSLVFFVLWQYFVVKGLFLLNSFDNKEMLKMGEYKNGRKRIRNAKAQL